ncbi:MULTISPECIES: hypothetical protein [Geobacillus]|jgi:F0F1-type ATP synthase assembly protein I|uniref:Uncharacterized protein n=1 Tax=Geobacillus thermodenitrificans (strain NG80-2) TaxID=420246 RepID=A4IPL0_GEOTN|nr:MULTISPECIES: hypothetical protein [Geobacillus]ABO67264.1 hypothetical protein GTNG_1906 [Geobacillus thermodenitrificans NG80-2]ARP43058.1 hypothetical protein GTHT12_01521 [Geobacillus thermodenitrificans]KQB93071.1 hypothetical protein GEPA3_1949 [Geobacillus sp. PA-3]MEC5189236.1 F0F1-type ATP synthase assembly protein I [Geobacillus thermodenitrificans]MED0662040.1 hypothetical protein [Geobacillus thermodenitrificans]
MELTYEDASKATRGYLVWLFDESVDFLSAHEAFLPVCPFVSSLFYFTASTSCLIVSISRFYLASCFHVLFHGVHILLRRLYALLHRCHIVRNVSHKVG